jgi:hypothetical protein
VLHNGTDRTVGAPNGLQLPLSTVGRVFTASEWKNTGKLWRCTHRVQQDLVGELKDALLEQ